MSTTLKSRDLLYRSDAGEECALRCSRAYDTMTPKMHSTGSKIIPSVFYLRDSDMRCVRAKSACSIRKPGKHTSFAITSTSRNEGLLRGNTMFQKNKYTLDHMKSSLLYNTHGKIYGLFPSFVSTNVINCHKFGKGNHRCRNHNPIRSERLGEGEGQMEKMSSEDDE